MSRNKRLIVKSLAAAAIVGLSAYGLAFADDSSMSMWTGDSYAFFNNLDNSPGHFNTARAAPKAAESVATKAPAKTPDAGDRHTMMTHRTLTGTATNPFRNDTGA
jgi:hypothetical protein